MTEFEWKQQASRGDVAALLRRIADGLDGGTVGLSHDTWELKVGVAEQVELEVELEVESGETELEIELKWAAPAAQGGEGGH